MDQGSENRAERRRIIERPRLLRLLDETDARVILLVAPAGYGKSTLARQWLARAPRQAVTFHATAGARDTAALASGLALAASSLFEQTGEGLLRRLAVVAAPSMGPREMADILAEDLRSWPPNAWLVIEDTHVLSETESSAFLEHLLARAPVHILLTSRTRPPWITTRQIVYAEIAEIGREALAFTRDEVASLLAERDGAVDELLALSAGWPAVLGLASLSSDPVPAVRDVPTALYDYFAEELYQLAAGDLQEALQTLATAEEIDMGLLRQLFGPRAYEIAESGNKAGFLEVLDGGVLDLHPLLRTFLLRKPSEERVRRSAIQVAEYYLQTKAWDSAFATISRFSLQGLVDALLEGGLDDCFARGHLATAGKWLGLADAWKITSPIRDIAEGEYALRRGDYGYAASRLESAIQNLPATSSRLAHASYRLGQARQFLSLTDAAMAAYRAAEENACTPQTRRAALWGMFTLACETDGVGLSGYMRDFQACGHLGADDAVRVANGLIALEVRRGNLRYAMRAVDRAMPDLERVRDPMIRTSFLNAAINALLVGADYTDALRLTARQIADAKRFRLHFVMPHALLNQAACLVGLRRIDQAARAVEAAERHFGSRGDTFAETNIITLRAKVAIAEGRLDRARLVLESRFSTTTGTTLDAELAGLLGLVVAALGELGDAATWIARAESLENTYDTQTTTAWAGAICAFRDSRDREPILRLFEQADTSGYVEPLVTAYRALPEILAVVQDDTRISPTRASRILAKTNDTALIRRWGRKEGAAISLLSPREIEVSELLVRGMSNREIAAELCISEVTAKVHMRHILEKLGARSRTQAALLLAERSPR